MHERQAVTWTREQPTASGSPTGRFAAYAALALVLLGLPLLAVSETGCGWNAAANNHTGYIGEPGATAGPVAFLLGPLLAIVALSYSPEPRVVTTKHGRVFRLLRQSRSSPSHWRTSSFGS